MSTPQTTPTSAEPVANRYDPNGPMPALSPSMLNTFALEGPDAFYRVHLLGERQPERSYFTLGSLVELWLVNGLEASLQSGNFYFGTAPAPSGGKIETFCTTYLNYLSTVDYNDDEEQRAFEIAYRAAEYSYSESRVRQELEKPAVAQYLKERLQALRDGKSYVPPDMIRQAKMIVDAAVDDPILGPLARLFRERDRNPDGLKIEFQRELRWQNTIPSWEDPSQHVRQPLIGHPDIVITRDEHRIQCIDIKTTSKHPLVFARAYRTYRYYVQLAMYYDGLAYEETDAAPDRPVVVELPQFMVLPKTAGQRPMLYQMDGCDIDHGLAESQAVASRILQHHADKQWDMPLEYQRQGVLTLREFPYPI